MDGPFLLVLSSLIFYVTKCKAAIHFILFIIIFRSLGRNSGQTGGLRGAYRSTT
jgi:hypothetical protein